MSIVRDYKKTDDCPMKMHVEFFDTADEVVRTCQQRERTSESFDDMAKDGKVSKTFHSVNSYGEALELMRTGYQPTVDSMKNVFSATITGEAKRFAFENNVHGFAPTVPLALKGVPNSMMNVRMKPMKAKVIDVIYNCTVHARIKWEDLVKAGQAMLGAIIELEQQGYRINLYGMQAYCSRNTKDADVMIVKMKSATQPLDLKRVSFPLTHPAFFRVIGFDWYSKFPGAVYRSGYGLPMSTTLSDKEVQMVGKKLVGDTAVTFSAQTMIGKTSENVKETIENAKRES